MHERLFDRTEIPHSVVEDRHLHLIARSLSRAGTSTLASNARRLLQRPAETLENRLTHVMVIASRKLLNVQRHVSMRAERPQEFANILGRQFADFVPGEGNLVKQSRPAANIQRYQDER